VTVTRERTAGTEPLDAEVLFEEARVLRRQRWGRAGRFAIVAAIGITAGLVLTSGGGSPPSRSTAAGAGGEGSLTVAAEHDGTAAIALPSTVSFSSFTPEPGHLALTGAGEHQDSSSCLLGTLELASARLTDIDEVNASGVGSNVGGCGSSVSAPAPVSVSDGINDTAVRVMTAIRGGRPVYGPIVANYSVCSTCDPDFAAADGSIWVFMPGPTAHVLRLSPITGGVLNTIPIAGHSARASIAADADGLWITFSANGWYGGSMPRGDTPLIHIAPGSNVAEIRPLPGNATTWMYAIGHTLWLGMESLDDSRPDSVFRFDGPSGLERYQVPITNPVLQSSYGGIEWTVIGNPAEGLWSALTVLSPWQRGVQQVALGIDVVRIDPSNGSFHVVTELHPTNLTEFWTVHPGDIGIDGNNLYLLATNDNNQDPSTLYRVAI
jgi:hypothetical protein